MEINFRQITSDDWPLIAEIYKQGIYSGNATFEQKVPEWEDWDKAHMPLCRIVALVNNAVVGWAALSFVSERCVYSGVAEVSVYVSNRFQGQKIGLNLLSKLISESENLNIWTLQAGIFSENFASLKLHQKLGFRTIGMREKIGKMDGRWRDTVLLERRSKMVGID